MSDIIGPIISPELAMYVLGITADQLKIARALDRDRIEILRKVCNHGVKFDNIYNQIILSDIARQFLPIFEDEKK